MTAIRIFAAAACCLVTTTAGMAGKPAPTVAPVPLSVTFDDGGDNRITSDGQGEYIDGDRGVAASFDKYGNLIINFQTLRVPDRKIGYDYDASVDPGLEPHEDGFIWPINSYLSTIPVTPGKLQDMQQGATLCLRGFLTFTNDAATIQYRNSFQRPTGGYYDAADTSYLVVTHPDDNTWIVEPGNYCGEGLPPAVAGVVKTPLTGKFKVDPVGEFVLPFRMTLTRVAQW